MQHWRRLLTRGRERALRQDPILRLLVGVCFRGQRTVHAQGQIPDAEGVAEQIVYAGGALLVCDYVGLGGEHDNVGGAGFPDTAATSSPSISGSS